jgi:hypothetical protein
MNFSNDNFITDKRFFGWQVEIRGVEVKKWKDSIGDNPTINGIFYCCLSTVMCDWKEEKRVF